MIARASDDREVHMFLQRFRELSCGGSRYERMPYKHCTKNMWVVKPAAQNQGRGIEVFKNAKDITNHIFSQKGSYWVIQKYIEKPLLYNGRKFDIRVWVLLTEKFQIYFYREGYLRTSSIDYSNQDKNLHVHLTNQCLQVNGAEYGKHEEGNVLSFKQF